MGNILLYNNHLEEISKEGPIMKVTSTSGDSWSGLAYWKDCSYRVDYFSSPDDLNFGFEITYRLVLNTSDIRLADKFRTVFKKAFGLSEEHYEVKQGPPTVVDSIFWTVYWDRQGFELNLLKKFETKLDEIAEAANTRVVILEIEINEYNLEISQIKLSVSMTLPRN
jgi:hypothetical protein